MCLSSVFIVQDHESGKFLYPFSGTVGFTELAKNAGHFHDEEEAITTAIDHCDRGFTVLHIVQNRNK